MSKRHQDETGDLVAFSRLDQLMVERGEAPSRSRAADAITRGTVLVDGMIAMKPSQKVSPLAEILLNDPAAPYVSRAALKLLAALDYFAFDPRGRICLDLGASTGGFTQVLTEKGASHVFAIDVGHSQMHPSLKGKPEITTIEGLNCRDLRQSHLMENEGNTSKITAIVCDVSFISLRLALPAALKLAHIGCWAALLVKPQFEVGKQAIGRGGIVRDPMAAKKAFDTIKTWMNDQTGWRVVGAMPSPIKGGDGNQEMVLGAVFEG